MPKQPSFPLAVMGLDHPWQAALLLPERYEDFSQLAQGIEDFTPPADKRPIALQVVSRPQVRWPARGSRSRRPWSIFDVRTPSGQTHMATLFGDTRELAEILSVGNTVPFLASVQDRYNGPALSLHELLDPSWVGRVRPIYAGKPRVITAEDVGRHVHSALPTSVDRSAAHLGEQLLMLGPVQDLLRDLGAEGWTLQQLLQQAHMPATYGHAQLAARVLRRIAALGALNRMPARRKGRARPLRLSTLDARIASLKITLTSDQARAVHTIAALMARPQPATALLSADVGCGKSIVAELLAIASIDAGGRAALMAPHARLAQQLHAETRAMFPDVSIALVTSENQEPPPPNTRLWIGTSAMLNRGLPAPDLLIVDEQHRFGVQEREQLAGPHTHILEMTATPIPRTQALVQFGGIDVVRMRQTHAPRTFHTTLHEGDQAMRQLFDQLAPCMRAGERLLVVYPLREATEEGAAQTMPGSERYAVDRAFERWNRSFPGRVATLTGDDDDATKESVLEEFARGTIPICLSTTVTELGLNISFLSRIVIICPERHGMTTLHQLRGRTARGGGDGYCELLCPEAISASTRARLQTFVNTSDGFELAEMDWERRGSGDLGERARRQSGADGTCLFRVKLDAGLLHEAMPVLERWRPGLHGRSG